MFRSRLLARWWLAPEQYCFEVAIAGTYLLLAEWSMTVRLLQYAVIRPTSVFESGVQSPVACLLSVQALLGTSNGYRCLCWIA